MAITVRLDDDDNAAIRYYARTHNLSVSEFARQSMIEKIENEYDLASIVEYENAMAKGLLVTHSHDDVVRELGI